MATRSMICIDETKDELKRILMFFDIYFSDRLKNEWDCNAQRRNLGGGVEKLKENLSCEEPNKFYANCNSKHGINKKKISKFDKHRYRDYYRLPDHSNQRDNIDYHNKSRQIHYRPFRHPHHVSPQPVNALNYEYTPESYGADRAYRRLHYQVEPEVSEIALSRSYPGEVRDYSQSELYSRYGSHYDYFSHLARPPCITPPSQLPIDYYSYCEHPQREYKYPPRIPIYPGSPMNRYRQASGLGASEYPPLCRHDSYASNISQELAPYSPDYSYDKYSKEKIGQGNYNRYRKCDYFNKRSKNNDFYNTPRLQVPSVSYKEAYCLNKIKAKSIPPEPIPNQYSFYINGDPISETTNKADYQYKVNRSKPSSNHPKPAPSIEKYRNHFCTSKKSKYSSNPKSRTTQPLTIRKSVERRGTAGLDINIEIPHKMQKESKILSRVSLTKRNRSYTDRKEGHSFAPFSGMDIPYKRKERENSLASKCASQTEKRYDSGCDYWPNNIYYIPEIPQNCVSFPCHRSPNCQGCPPSLHPSYCGPFCDVRCTAHQKSIKQRISGFLKKSKVCLKRSKGKTCKRKCKCNNAQTQCSDWENEFSTKLNTSSRNRLQKTNGCASCLSVRGKWYSKLQRKNVCSVPCNSRNMTSSKYNSYRFRIAYPTVYRDKCNPQKENYQHYSMLNYSTPIRPSNSCSNKYNASACCSNEDNDNENEDRISSDCSNFCSKVNALRNVRSQDSSRCPTTICKACTSQSSLTNSESCRRQANYNASKTNNINVCLTIRAEDVNLIGSPNIITSKKNDSRCKVSPSTDTLTGRGNRFSNNRCLKNSPNPSQSSLSECASGLSNSSLNKNTCKKPTSCMANRAKPSRPSLKRRDPNDMRPRPSKRVSLNTNCNIIRDQKTCPKRSSQQCGIKKYPSSESLRRSCRNNLPKRSCSETTINSNLSLKNTCQRSSNMNEIFSRTNCKPCSSYGKEKSVLRNRSCKPQNICTNNLQNTSKTSLNSKSKLACKRNSTESCNSKRSLQNTDSCPKQNTGIDEENPCPCRSAIEELKEELLQTLQCKQISGVSPTPEVAFIPCVPDAFCHMNNQVTNPFGKSYNQSISSWGQMKGPL